jgi:hypothetical protein
MIFYDPQKKEMVFYFSLKSTTGYDKTRAQIKIVVQPCRLQLHYQRGTKSSRLYWTSLDRISLLFLTVYPCLINQSYFGKGKGDDKL